MIFHYFQGRAEQNEHHKLAEMVKKIEHELQEAKSEVVEKQKLYEKCVSTVSTLEKSIREHGNNREGQLKDLEGKNKSIKSQMQSASKDLKRKGETCYGNGSCCARTCIFGKPL